MSRSVLQKRADVVPGAQPSSAYPTAAEAKPGGTALDRFVDPYLAFSYPSNWEARAYTEVSSFTDALVFLSSEHMHRPCTTTHKASETVVSCGQPLSHLAPGGILVEWSVDGFLGWTLAKAPGKRATVGGLPAKEEVTAGRGACPAGAAEQITVELARHVPENFYDMTTCIGEAHRAIGTAQVQAMLRTLHIQRS